MIQLTIFLNISWRLGDELAKITRCVPKIFMMGSNIVHCMEKNKEH